MSPARPLTISAAPASESTRVEQLGGLLVVAGSHGGDDGVAVVGQRHGCRQHVERLAAPDRRRGSRTAPPPRPASSANTVSARRSPSPRGPPTRRRQLALDRSQRAPEQLGLGRRQPVERSANSSSSSISTRPTRDLTGPRRRSRRPFRCGGTDPISSVAASATAGSSAAGPSSRVPSPSSAARADGDGHDGDEQPDDRAHGTTTNTHAPGTHAGRHGGRLARRSGGRGRVAGHAGAVWPPLDRPDARSPTASTPAAPALAARSGPGRIRTSVGDAGRFTVCSLWPLGHRPRWRR